MKFQPDQASSGNLISRVEPGRLWVGSIATALASSSGSGRSIAATAPITSTTEWTSSLIVPWQGPVQAWMPSSFEALQESDFEALVALKPEVLILGSGSRIRFVAPKLLRALMQVRIGVETMDTPAACRTYNVLASEHRAVVAALLLGPGT